MRIFIIILSLWASQAQAKTLFHCVPMGGQLLGDNFLQINYALEQAEGEEYFLRLRKGYLTTNDETYVERLMFKLGFNWQVGAEEFELNYMTPEGFFSLKGRAEQVKTKPGGADHLVEAEIALDLSPEVAPFASILNSSEPIEKWSCLINLSEVSVLQRPDETP